MGNRRIDPRKQFSKWLARYGAVAWGVFLAAVVFLMCYRPETANACIYLVLIVTFNKMVDTLAYTKNSTTEKVLLAALDRTKMELTLKNSNDGKSGSDSSESSEADEEIADDEGGSG